MARNISFPNPSFSGLNLFLGNKESKKWHYSNTFIERNSDESISVRLYGTKIVTFYQNGDIKVNTGGYNTPTTYRRINSFLPVGKVYQKGYRSYYQKGDALYSLEYGAIIIN